MRIGFFQFNPEFGNKTANLEKIEHAVAGQRADLLALPELCTTGYQFISSEEAAECAEPIPGGESIQRLISISQMSGIHLIAGIAEKDGENIYNSAVLIGPDGVLSRYRKIHLFFEETLWFKQGEELPEITEIGGARIAMIICFDWLFPELFRILMLNGVDVIVQPANLVLPYCQSAMQTRSIENRIYSITANRIGKEARGGKKPLAFTGKSQITGIHGNVLVQAAADSEELHIVEIDPHKARDKSITIYNSIISSRRPELYTEILQQNNKTGD